MSVKKYSGGLLYEEGGGAWPNEESVRNHEAVHRQIIGAAVAALEQAKRPQFADNGDGTITLMTSTTITDAGDGTLTIGA